VAYGSATTSAPARSSDVDPDRAEALLNHLLGARWFAGKGRAAQLASVVALPWLTEVNVWPAVRSEIVEVAYRADEDPDPDDEDEVVWPRELYQVAVSYSHAPVPGLAHAEIGRFPIRDLGPVVAYDAAHDPQACRVLLRSLLRNRHLRDHDRAGGDLEVQFHVAEADGLHEDLEPRVFRGQQSNTSIMFGEAGMIKLFRRLEVGHNLDIEVHDALRKAGVHDVATLYGWVEAAWTPEGDPVRADLAMAVEKLAQAEDGWELALDSLRGERSFAAEAAQLGHALAEIHAALRTAFPVGQQPGSAVAMIMKSRLSAAAEAAPALGPYVEGLAGLFDRLGEGSLPVQRVHGDFHLGQTLKTPSGWKLIDFEGEPAKTLAERAAPDSVWRDVAGMLRSFDYAAASLPGPRSAEWAAQAREAFLSGYAGGDLSAGDAALLAPYEADKAIYEVIYEVRNRPDWVAIPLAAVAGLARSEHSNPTVGPTKE
jgi:maltokinase